jgi:hypothetical protein
MSTPKGTSTKSPTDALFSSLGLSGIEREVLPKVPPNPIHQTNEELSELSGTVRQLVDIGRHQSELSQALTETSQLALQQSIASGEAANRAIQQARNGVLIAAVTLLISVIVAGINIYDSHALSNSTDTKLERLITSVDRLGVEMKARGSSDSQRAGDEIHALQEIERQLQTINAQHPTNVPGRKKGS